MKSITSFIICFLMYGLIHCGSGVPDVVLDAFQKKFPEATKIRWESEPGEEWEADFTLKKTDCSAVFQEDGAWLVTEREISNNSIPSAIMEIIKKDFKLYNIEEAESVETKAGIFYELEMVMGKQEFEILFNSEGKEIERETESEDDD